MERTAVSSSNIESVGYEESTLTLEIEFKSGKVYHYFDVPQTMHGALMSAGSLGTFFNRNIRDAFRCALL